MKPRRRKKTAALTQEETEALLDALQGEMKELALLVLLTRWPARVVAQWKASEVVPLIQQLADAFQGMDLSEPDALLFPNLAKLPPHLFGEAGDARSTPPPTTASLRHLFSNTLATLDQTAMMPLLARASPSISRVYSRPTTKQCAAAIKRIGNRRSH